MSAKNLPSSEMPLSARRLPLVVHTARPSIVVHVVSCLTGYTDSPSSVMNRRTSCEVARLKSLTPASRSSCPLPYGTATAKQWPPSRGSSSNSVTSTPASTRTFAAPIPAAPPPMTATFAMPRRCYARSRTTRLQLGEETGSLRRMRADVRATVLAAGACAIVGLAVVGFIRGGDATPGPSEGTRFVLAPEGDLAPRLLDHAADLVRSRLAAYGSGTSVSVVAKDGVIVADVGGLSGGAVDDVA